MLLWKLDNSFHVCVVGAFVLIRFLRPNRGAATVLGHRHVACANCVTGLKTLVAGSLNVVGCIVLYGVLVILVAVGS